MAFACISGGRECRGCGRCASAPQCDSCQVAIGRGQEYYEGTFGIICADCASSDTLEAETVCSLCEEKIFVGEEIIILNSLKLCGECADRCIR